MNILQIAKKLNVSSATVSRALNPTTERFVKEKTRLRIQNFARKTNYVPNPLAKTLQTGKSWNIGVVVASDVTGIYYGEVLTKFLAWIFEALRADNRFNCKLMIIPREESLSHSDEMALKTTVDGILLTCLRSRSIKMVRALYKKFQRETKIPLVGVNILPRDGIKGNLVYYNQSKSTRLALTHLIQKGHRHIALIYGDNKEEEDRDRVNSFEKTMRDNKLPYSASMITQGHYHPEGGYKATLNLLDQAKRRPTAIFCTNDQMATGCIQALKSLKIKCPQEIAVMGYDGLEFGQYIDPQISTLVQPVEAMAQESIQLLFGLIDKKIKKPVKKIISSQLLIRKST